MNFTAGAGCWHCYIQQDLHSTLHPQQQLHLEVGKVTRCRRRKSAFPFNWNASYCKADRAADTVVGSYLLNMTNHFLNNTTNNNTPEQTCAWTLLLNTIVRRRDGEWLRRPWQTNKEVQLHNVQDGFACSRDTTVKSIAHGEGYEEKSSYVMLKTPKSGDVVREDCEFPSRRTSTLVDCQGISYPLIDSQWETDSTTKDRLVSTHAMPMS